MIVSNEKLLFGGGYIGVCYAEGFRCTVRTVTKDLDEPVIVIGAFAGDWAKANVIPVAEAYLTAFETADELGTVHLKLLEEINRLGATGHDLSTAIEKSLLALSAVVLTFENRAIGLLREGYP